MTKTLRLLANYYGFLQGVHLAVLGYGLIRYIQADTIGFPAPPPLAGWSEQATFFLLGNGILDGIVAVAAQMSVTGYLRRRPWGLPAVLSCVTASLCSGMFFLVGTWLSGAWEQHPINYLGLVLVFSPVAALFALLVRRIVAEN